jgi:hypothetical protein
MHEYVGATITERVISQGAMLVCNRYIKEVEEISD